MKNNLLTAFPIAAASLLLASAPDSSAALIADESFQTVASAISDAANEFYSNGDSMQFASNRSTVGATNFGFNSSNTWANSNSAAQPFTAINLTHNGTSDELEGGIALNPIGNTPRNSNRLLEP